MRSYTKVTVHSSDHLPHGPNPNPIPHLYVNATLPLNLTQTYPPPFLVGLGLDSGLALRLGTRSGPLGPNRASLLMNPMYSIARTRQCPRKSCSPQRSSSYSAHPSGWYSYSSNSKDAGFIDAPMPISPHCIAAAHVQAPPSAGVGSRNGSCVGSVESNIKINLPVQHPHYKQTNPNPNGST